MIALKNGSDCKHNFNKVYLSRDIKKKTKKTISNLKKASSSDSLQSYETDIIDNNINANKLDNTFSNKIKFKIFNDIDFVNIDNKGQFELSIHLPSNLNIVTINKIKLSNKILLSDINIFANNKIIFNKEDISFLGNKYNNKSNKLDFTDCIEDIVINMLIDNKNINQIVGKQILISYTSEIIEEQSKKNFKF